MGKKSEKEEVNDKVVVAEIKVSMHCDACERTVARVISKFKGLENFTTDMKKHKVVVTGRIDPKKVVKKLKKKMGKKVEMILVKNKEEGRKEGKPEEEHSVLKPVVNPLLLDCCRESSQVLMVFSDDNPNACSIM